MLLLGFVTSDVLDARVLLSGVVIIVPLLELLAGVVDFEMTAAPELLAAVPRLDVATTVTLPELGKVGVLDLGVVTAVPLPELEGTGEIDLEVTAVPLETWGVDLGVVTTVPLPEIEVTGVLDLEVMTAVPPEDTGVLDLGVVTADPLEETDVLDLGVVAANPLEEMGVLDFEVGTADPLPEMDFAVAFDVVSVPLEIGVLLLEVVTLSELAGLIDSELAEDPEYEELGEVLSIGVLFFVLVLSTVPELVFGVILGAVPELAGLVLLFDAMLETAVRLLAVVGAPEPVEDTIGEVDLAAVPVLESV